MKKTLSTWLVLGAAASFAANVFVDEGNTNRLTFSARFGFGIKANFKSIKPTSTPNNLRNTPDGDPYNYDDGYVGGVGGLRPDISGNAGGQTWYWGYDGASQVSGDTILLSRSGAVGNYPGHSMRDDPSTGAELVYSRQLFARETTRLGFEAAANYMNLSLDGSTAFLAQLTRVTDAYPFTSGTTPPGVDPDPYQGSFNGPGFLIGDMPVSSSTTIISGATLVDRRRLDADIWGFRLGPYAEFPITEDVNLRLSGGMAVALLDTDAAWSITGTALSGKGHNDGVLFGGYLAANLSWQICGNWSAVAGVQYQNLGKYEHSFGGRSVELDMHHSFFVTVGIGFSF